MKIYIGYDSERPTEYDVCKYSIEKHQSKENDIYPLNRGFMVACGLYNRHPYDDEGSTEFTYTRFLVPILNHFRDEPVLFVDSDFLFTSDVNELENYYDKTKAVSVVKFPSYDVHSSTKMNGKQQRSYSRKNWSSLMLFNTGHPSNSLLTSENVSTWTGNYLHRFHWLMDSEIGELPFSWNVLAGYTKLNAELYYSHGWNRTIDAVHYTDGTPLVTGYEFVEFHKLYMDTMIEMRDKKND